MKEALGGPLLALLYQCTARVIVQGSKGTGFFVAPGKLLTCTHVIEEATKSETPISVRYQNKDYPVISKQVTDANYPDLALLQVEIQKDHPCALLGGDLDIDDPVYGYGFQKDYPGGEGSDGVYEGPSWMDDAQEKLLLKFSDVQIIPGFSGGPLLNRRTGLVCGVIKRTRGETSSLGGRAVPIDVAIERFELASLQADFHSVDRRWATALEEQRSPRSGVEALPPTSRIDIFLYERANNDLAEKPLFGRDETLTQVNRWLDGGQRVLLYGLAASGKTVLAANIAQRRLEGGGGSYIWTHARQSAPEDLLDALARRFGTDKEQQEFARLALEGKIRATRKLFERSGAKLLVIDDAARGSTLKAILQATPDGIGVLVTSRTPYTPGNGLDESLEVGDLTRKHALEMLVALSNRPALSHDPQSETLLIELGYHPYSIEIAAYQLRRDPAWRPGELLEMIADAPHDLEMPGEFAEQGRESMKHLLDAIVDSLRRSTGERSSDQKNQKALQTWIAFGAFFDSGATVDLLARYLGLSTGETLASLNRLKEFSLTRQVPETRYFDIHDLVFHYARALWKEGSGGGNLAALQAVEAFLEKHATDYDLLDSDMENLMGAARQAEKESPKIFSEIITGLACGGYMDSYGHTADFLKLLDSAINLERGDGDEQKLHYLLSKRGNAHFNLLEDQDAERCYKEALDLAPDWARRVKLLAVLGKTCTRMGAMQTAQEHFQHSYAILEENRKAEDPATYLGAQVFILQQQVHAAGMIGDYDRVRALATQGLEVSMQIGDEIQKGIFYTNLGINELNQGASRAMEYHRQAQQIGETSDDKQLKANAHYGLGLSYLILDQYTSARQHLLLAKELFAEIGERDKINLLNALAQVLQD